MVLYPQFTFSEQTLHVQMNTEDWRLYLSKLNLPKSTVKDFLNFHFLIIILTDFYS